MVTAVTWYYYKCTPLIYIWSHALCVHLIIIIIIFFPTLCVYYVLCSFEDDRHMTINCIFLGTWDLVKTRGNIPWEPSVSYV